MGYNLDLCETLSVKWKGYRSLINFEDIEGDDEEIMSWWHMFDIES